MLSMITRDIGKEIYVVFHVLFPNVHGTPLDLLNRAARLLGFPVGSLRTTDLGAYIGSLKNLLWMEEMQMTHDIAQYDLHDVTFE